MVKQLFMLLPLQQNSQQAVIVMTKKVAVIFNSSLLVKEVS